jgi:hypothetical protein
VLSSHPLHLHPFFLPVFPSLPDTEDETIPANQIGTPHGNARAMFTDTTENLAKFVAEAGDDLFSKDVLKLQRVK